MKTASQTVEKKSPLAPRPSPDEILERGKRVLQAEANAILDCLACLNSSFVDAVSAILQCKGRVCVTGVGKAGLIGAKIQATLASTGTLAYSLHPVDALHGDLGMVHPEDVVLALSKSGSSELIELLPRLRKLGCKIILMTAKKSSPASAHADYVLEIGQTQEACPLGLAPSSSTTAMLALGDALALTVMGIKEISPRQYADYHPGGALGRYLMKAGEIMRTGAECPTVRHDATLGHCYEAILAAPRRAGAASVVDDQGRLVGIITHGDFFRLFNSPKASIHVSVREVMTKAPKCIAADARAHEALALMRAHAIDELPVVDEEHRLVGVIDIQDLIARGFSIFDAS